MRYADDPDLAALIVPRPLLIENATDDLHYEQQAVHEALDLTARAYAAQGAPDHFDGDSFTGGQVIGRVASAVALAAEGAMLAPVDLVTLRHQVVMLCHPLRVSFHMGRHIPCLNAEGSAA